MKYFKKVFSYCLCLVLCLTVIPLSDITAKAETYIEGDYEYTVDYYGGVEITDYTGTSDVVVIPSTLGGYKVTSIDGLAFSYCSNIVSLTIPDTVLHIGNSAFSDCLSLQIINIPKSVYSLGTSIFNRCYNLTTINIDEDNISYSSADGIMYNKNKTEIIAYPAGKKDSVFYVPESVTHLGFWAFDECIRLKKIILPENVYHIEGGTFNTCLFLESIETTGTDGKFYSINGILYDRENNIIHTYPAGRLGDSYTIPNGITGIGDYAFYNCTAINNVIMPEGITTIGNYAFEYCGEIEKFNFPSTLKSVGSLVFGDCASLESLIFPEGLTEIGDAICWGCYSLETVIIPDSVISIGAYCFSGVKCFQNSANWDNGVLYVGNHIVETNSSVPSEYTVKAGTISIAEGTFRTSPWLTTITLPDSIKAIHDEAFENCTNITDVYYTGSQEDRENILANWHISALGDAIWHYNAVMKVSNLVARTISNGIKLAWTASGNVTYRVYRSTYSGGVWTEYKLFAKPADPTYTDKTVKSGMQVSYIVYAQKGTEISEESEPINITYLAQPTVNLSPSTTGVKVSWNKIAGATGYRVYRSTYSGGNWSDYEFFTNTVKLTCTDTEVTSGKKYRYTVDAFNYNSTSAYNDGVTTIYLSKPIVEVKNTSNGAKVTWNKVPGAMSYRVYRSVYSGGKWSEYTLFAKPTTNSYTDKTVKAGTKYKYVIYAYNGNYKSEYSSSATTVYLKQPTVKLTNAKTGVYISWGKVTGATSYKVYRSVYSGGKWSEYKLFAKPTANYYTDKTVKSGARVRYTVYACNGSYQSLYKTGVITTYLSPRTPNVGKASNGIKVSWTKATGAKGYTVYRRTYSGGKWSELKAMYKTAKLTVTDKTAKKGVKYQYVVRAYDGNYKSAIIYSSIITR